MRPLRAIVWLSLLATAGCGGGADKRPPPVPPRQAALPPAESEPAEDAAARRVRFCGDLSRVIDAEPGGFATMRGPAWRPALGRPHGASGSADCRVEGDYYPGASYVCRGEAIGGGSADLLLPGYQKLAEDVGYCLEQPVWYPRMWRQGQDFEFAGGERQTIWRDGSTGPKPTVALKIEEDLAGRFYFLRLAVASRPLTLSQLLQP